MPNQQETYAEGRNGSVNFRLRGTTRKKFLKGLTAVGGIAAPLAVFASAVRRQRNFLDVTWWDPHVETISDAATYLRRKFRQDVTDPSTGVGQQAIKKILAQTVASGKAAGESWRITKARCFAALTMADGLGRIFADGGRVPVLLAGFGAGLSAAAAATTVGNYRNGVVEI